MVTPACGGGVGAKKVSNVVERVVESKVSLRELSSPLGDRSCPAGVRAKTAHRAQRLTNGPNDDEMAICAQSGLAITRMRVSSLR